MRYSYALVAFALVILVPFAIDGVAPAQERTPTAPRRARPPAPPKSSPAPAVTEKSSPEAEKSTEIKVAGAKWVSQCASASRQSQVECTMEQTILLNNTRQLLASVVLRVPADTHQPVMMVHVPVGLYIPAGLTLQIDEGKPLSIGLQTCDLKGCYAGETVPKDMIESMKGGKRLAITFQNVAKQSITVPLTLDNFAEAYQKIQ